MTLEIPPAPMRFARVSATCRTVDCPRFEVTTEIAQAFVNADDSIPVLCNGCGNLEEVVVIEPPAETADEMIDRQDVINAIEYLRTIVATPNADLTNDQMKTAFKVLLRLLNRARRL